MNDEQSSFSTFRKLLVLQIKSQIKSVGFCRLVYDMIEGKDPSMVVI